MRERFEIKDAKGNKIPIQFRTLSEQKKIESGKGEKEAQRGEGGQDLFIRITDAEPPKSLNGTYVPGIQATQEPKRPGSRGY